MPSFPLRVASVTRTVLLGAVLVTVAVPASSVAATSTVPAVPPATGNEVVPPGVSFRGIDLSGLSQTEAKSKLRGTLATKPPSTEDVVVTIAGRPHKLQMAKIAYRFDLERLSHAAVDAKPGTALPVMTTWSVGSAARWFRSLSSMRRSTRDARIKIGITKQRYTGSRKGWRVDRRRLEALVTPALEDPAASRELRLKVVRTSPSMTVNGLKRRYGTLVTVDRTTFKLRVFKRLRLSKTYRIAVGSAGHTTPAGMYSITSKQVNPAWHVPNSAWAGSLQGQVIPGGAPNNPLKARWLGLRDGIGIHGTSESWSIGTRASHGCLRMHVKDVVDLYPRIPMGTQVKIR